VISICNVVGSTITRESHGTIYTHAGPEIGVASTKAFTSQLVALFLLTLYLGKVHGTITAAQGRELGCGLVDLPAVIEKELPRLHTELEIMAGEFIRCRDFLYLGRGVNFPIALEGALKLKEISYIHAEGYPAGELKHGPIALIDKDMPVLALVPPDAVHGKVISNVEEVKARRGRIILVGSQNDSQLKEVREELILLTGKKVNFHEVDLLDLAGVAGVFEQHPNTSAVIHFAGLKAVGESVTQPLAYYQNNIAGTLNLCQVMAKYNVHNIVFSSSATVYGDPASVPITEDFPLSCTNPYGRTKLMVEDILTDLNVADQNWHVVLLRYFNPVGAHKSGLIGEDPGGVPNNLMLYISQVAVGSLETLAVFGDDYQTPDGTGVRDYIHVVDLAKGHLKALERLQDEPGVVIYNLGTGNGYSVLDMVKAFEKASGNKVAYRIAPRRPGDIAQCYANPALAEKELGWKAEYNLTKMCEDTWRWQSNNPQGYRDK